LKQTTKTCTRCTQSQKKKNREERKKREGDKVWVGVGKKRKEKKESLFLSDPFFSSCRWGESTMLGEKTRGGCRVWS
jgi:hypothetical protein